jgi:glycosyltransferase involved in cell wall biosynthesis
MNLKGNAVIWNAHWEALGGGERYALELGTALRNQGWTVTYLGTCQFPGPELRRIFNMEMRETDYLSVVSEGEVYQLASVADLFVNASYGSRMRSPHLNSIYICHFPFGIKVQHLLGRMLGKALFLHGKSLQVSADFQNNILIQEEAEVRCNTEIEITLNSQTNTWSIFSENSNYSLALSNQKVSLKPGLYFLQKKSKNPLTLKIAGFEQPKVKNLVLHHLVARMNFKDSYKQVWVHSNYVKYWTNKFWRRNALVVYPPVSIDKRKSNEKNQYKIVSVGRFMSKKAGHSKNQLELVSAFSKLIRKSSFPWELHLVGGVSSAQQKYFDKVQRKAKNLKVIMHPNASLSELDELYSTSTFYWHASGLNQPKSQPGRFEHFGITVVEAMSKGLIPLVFNVGGPAEILQKFPNLLYSSTKDLVEKTIRISEDDVINLKQELMERAEQFDSHNFHQSAIANIEQLRIFKIPNHEK